VWADWRMAPPASSTTGGLEVVVLPEIKLNIKSKAQGETCICVQDFTNLLEINKNALTFDIKHKI
jgi:hypothetical protein